MLMSLIVVVLLAMLGLAERRGRQRFWLFHDAFRCQLRAVGSTPTAWPRLTRRWSRPMWATWDGDVLVVRRGPVFARTVPVRATVTSAGLYVLPPGEGKRCGHRPVAVCLQTPDGSLVELATDGETRMLLVGPFLTAAVNDLPQAPAPRYRG